MQRQNVRVIVASEYPEVRHFLTEVVEEQGRAVIVGQAVNSTKALTLVRRLRPDVAIIDCHLPHVVGLDTVPQSRIGGLDTAQTISKEIPNTRVIVPIWKWKSHEKDGLGPEVTASLSRDVTGANIPFTLQELCHEVAPPDTLVFANVEVKPRAVFRQRVSTISDKAVLFGGLGILSGVILMLTVMLAGAGVFVAAAGAATLLLGLAGKLAVALWPKTLQPGAPD